jgi:octaprenyl-diphosphate synthase
MDSTFTACSTREETHANLLHRLYGPIVEPLREVERQFHRELQSPFESLAPVLSHGTQLGGKRLRPAMLLLAGAASGQIDRRHIILATVIEMVHTATLVHDDVLDSASTRRHVPTINARWNNHTSILLGDYLFAQSFRLAATLPSTEACQLIGEASRLVCEGELRQVLHRDDVELDEETYLSMIGGKTAELCRVACQLGAMFSGADESTVEAMSVYGYSVGVAFQIADDFLDLWGQDDTVGKTLGTDIGQGKMTLPLIRLWQGLTDAERREVAQILKGPAERRLPSILPMLQRCDAQEYTRSVAESFRQQAVNCLDSLPESEAKASLAAIARFSVDRRF